MSNQISSQLESYLGEFKLEDYDNGPIDRVQPQYDKNKNNITRLLKQVGLSQYEDEFRKAIGKTDGPNEERFIYGIRNLQTIVKGDKELIRQCEQDIVKAMQKNLTKTYVKGINSDNKETPNISIEAAVNTVYNLATKSSIHKANINFSRLFGLGLSFEEIPISFVIQDIDKVKNYTPPNQYK